MRAPHALACALAGLVQSLTLTHIFTHLILYVMQVTEEEEELQRARLRVRRGPPLQDLSGTRGFPEDRPPQTPGRRPRPAAP